LQLGGEVSLPVPAGWSEMSLFSPGGSYIPLQLQLCLVSSSPSKVGQFSFECCPLSQEISSGIHHVTCFERFACRLTPSSQPLLLDSHSFTESLAFRILFLAPPSLYRAGSGFHPYLCHCCQITFHCLCYSVLLVSGADLNYVPGR
jgi:hypothetical protein